MAKALAKGKRFALAPYLLGHVYKVCSDLTDNPSNPNQGDPMWFLQMWILSYFKDLHQLVTFPDQIHIRTYAKRYSDITFHKNSFESCLQFFYLLPKEVLDKLFLPFDEKSIIISWVKGLIEANPLSPFQTGIWLDILSAQEIFLGNFLANYKKCSSEIYYPTQFARQFRNFQHIPILFFSRPNNPPIVKPNHISQK